MRDEKISFQSSAIATETRPTIVLWMASHMSPHRVQFDIAVAMHRVVFILGQAGFKTAFPQCATALVGTIDVLHITLAKMFHHHGRSGCLRWRKQQMHMVLHQAICMNRASMLVGLLFKQIQVVQVVLFSEEAGRAVVTSLNDVPRHTCDRQSRSSWHPHFPFDSTQQTRSIRSPRLEMDQTDEKG